MSLLFTVSPPKKSDVSTLLLPSLESLLSICKKHQNRKQKRLKIRATNLEQETKKETSVSQQGPSEPSDAPQKKKRRKTIDSDEDNGDSPNPGTSGESSTSKTDNGSATTPPRPKLHPLLGTRPTLDWVDHLAKAVHTAIQKVPK